MTVFLILQVIIVVALIAVILVQKTSSDGFTNGSGSGNSLMNVRSSANFFTKSTAILATVFMANSLWLGYMASTKEKPESIIDKAIESSEGANKKAEELKIEDIKVPLEGDAIKEEAKETLDNASGAVKDVLNSAKKTIDENTAKLENKAIDTSKKVEDTAEETTRKVEEKVENLTIPVAE